MCKNNDTYIFVCVKSLQSLLRYSKQMNPKDEMNKQMEVEEKRHKIFGSHSRFQRARVKLHHLLVGFGSVAAEGEGAVLLQWLPLEDFLGFARVKIISSVLLAFREPSYVDSTCYSSSRSIYV